MSTPGLTLPPFQVGSIWSSESISTFSNLCTKNLVSKAFSFGLVQETPPGWSVSLSFGINTLSDDGEKFAISLPGPFGSKKEAKAAACSGALPILNEAVERRNRDIVGKSLNGSGDAKNENWIGLLGEHCQQIRKPMPCFQEFGFGTSHSMEVTISDRPNEPFGGRAELFNNKKTAKANAAHEAVVWLRENGRMSRKNYSSTDIASSMERIGPSTLGPSSSPITVAREAGSASDSEVDSCGNDPDLYGQNEYSLGQQITALCQKLGFTSPTYKLTPDPRVPSMWSGAAYFVNDPAVALPGKPVGEVKMVFGKRRAKGEISKRVLGRLQEILVKREEEFVIASTVSMNSLDV